MAQRTVIGTNLLRVSAKNRSSFFMKLNLIFKSNPYSLTVRHISQQFYIFYWKKSIRNFMAFKKDVRNLSNAEFCVPRIEQWYSFRLIILMYLCFCTKKRRVWTHSTIEFQIWHSEQRFIWISRSVLTTYVCATVFGGSITYVVLHHFLREG